MRRRARSKDELDGEARLAGSAVPSSKQTPLVQRVLELQRDAGNQAVASVLDLRLHLLDLNGISSVKLTDPTPPWLPKAAPQAAKKDDSDDDSMKIWKLDFDLDTDPDSALGRELASAQRMKQIASGGKADADTPLGLQLTNAAVNVLANTDKGQELVNKLHLDHFSVVVDPVGGNYGVTVQFKFGK
jgi:hypothetical protein